MEKLKPAIIVYDFPRKYENGFTFSEVEKLFETYSDKLSKDKYDDALLGVTGQVINDEFVYYVHDVELAFRCAYENRNLTTREFD